jgi:hypothetical protein
MRVANLASGPLGGEVPFLRALIVFTVTGDTSKWRAAYAACRCAPDLAAGIVDPDFIEYHFELQRFEHRYEEFLSLLDHVVPASLPATGDLYSNFGPVGEQPVAVYRGWTHLLLGDRAAAAKDGRVVLDFLARQKETERNRFFRRLLAAQGYTFTGEHKRANEAARASLELAPRARNAITWVGVAALAARIHAWSGGEEEAVTLLEQLATATPGLPPGLLARDPLYSVPLARSQRYLALVSRLEAQIRDIRLQ